METTKEVYVVTEGPSGKVVWIRVGVAHANRDGSLSVTLDALPLSGKLVIRDPRPFGAEEK